MRSAVIEQLWESIADAGRDMLRARIGTKKRDLEQHCRDLLSTRGEASGTALAREVVAQVEAMTPEARTGFFGILANGFGVDLARLDQAIAEYRADPGQRQLGNLAEAVESRRALLFRRMIMAPRGTQVLVRLRGQLLEQLPERQELAPVDQDLKKLMTAWFNPGFLELRPIDWNSPASLLEKLVRYERVHRMRGLDDLRRRLESDRRFFAFFHPVLEDEPLIFVQVAFTVGVADKIQPLLDPSSPVTTAEPADTAVFYSISNCHEGLRGVTLGNFLIKLVVANLQQELPAIRTFVTLSPMPGFRRWLVAELTKGEAGELAAADRDLLARLEQDDWVGLKSEAALLREPLLRAAAFYLLRVKRDGRPVDPVARFHLGNGARLERINFLGDTSPKGIEEACGVLVNYRYAPSRIEENHERYATTGEVVAAAAVRSLVPAAG